MIIQKIANIFFGHAQYVEVFDMLSDKAILEYSNDEYLEITPTLDNLLVLREEGIITEDGAYQILREYVNVIHIVNEDYEHF